MQAPGLTSVWQRKFLDNSSKNEKARAGSSAYCREAPLWGCRASFNFARFLVAGLTFRSPAQHNKGYIVVGVAWASRRSSAPGGWHTRLGEPMESRARLGASSTRRPCHTKSTSLC